MAIDETPTTTTTNDADGDGLSDAFERRLGTDPSRRDTDGDGVADGEEVANRALNPRVARRFVGPPRPDADPTDTDGDGVADWIEQRRGSDPTVADVTADDIDNNRSPVDQFLHSARSQLGKRYRFGAEANPDDPAGAPAFDSSELVEWASHQAGLEGMPDGSWKQYRYLHDQGGAVPVDEALRTKGALVFGFSADPLASPDRPARAFVAISLGNGKVLEVSERGGALREVDPGTFYTHGATIPALHRPDGDLDGDGYPDEEELRAGGDPTRGLTEGQGSDRRPAPDVQVPEPVLEDPTPTPMQTEASAMPDDDVTILAGDAVSDPKQVEQDRNRLLNEQAQIRRRANDWTREAAERDRAGDPDAAARLRAVARQAHKAADAIETEAGYKGEALDRYAEADRLRALGDEQGARQAEAEGHQKAGVVVVGPDVPDLGEVRLGVEATGVLRPPDPGPVPGAPFQSSPDDAGPSAPDPGPPGSPAPVPGQPAPPVPPDPGPPGSPTPVPGQPAPPVPPDPGPPGSPTPVPGGPLPPSRPDPGFPGSPTPAPGGPTLPGQPVAFVDSDGDGLRDDIEQQLGTNAHSWDTDGDGRSDGMEVANTAFNPRVQQLHGQDAATIAAQEAEGTDFLVEAFGLDPNADSDADGFSDLIEGLRLTDPNEAGDLTVEMITNNRSPVDQFVHVARSQVGKPYRFGAEVNPDDPRGGAAYDSSELVQWTARQNGVELPDGSWKQYRHLHEVGAGVPVEQALQTKGALVFGFSSDPLASPDRPTRAFVGISLGNGKVIDISERGGAVRELDHGGFYTHGAVIPSLHTPTGDLDADGWTDQEELAQGGDPTRGITWSSTDGAIEVEGRHPVPDADSDGSTDPVNPGPQPAPANGVDPVTGAGVGPPDAERLPAADDAELMPPAPTNDSDLMPPDDGAPLPPNDSDLMPPQDEVPTHVASSDPQQDTYSDTWELT